MYFVYFLRSIPFPKQTYVGFTEDVPARIAKHNEGSCPHTAKWKPWNLMFYCAMPDKGRALDFEQYMKSHSGKAFAAKHLL